MPVISFNTLHSNALRIIIRERRALQRCNMRSADDTYDTHVIRPPYPRPTRVINSPGPSNLAKNNAMFIHFALDSYKAGPTVKHEHKIRRSCRRPRPRNSLDLYRLPLSAPDSCDLPRRVKVVKLQRCNSCFQTRG